MNTMTAETNAAREGTSVPLPWQTFYELGRQICIGCAVTFGPTGSRNEAGHTNHD